MVKIHNELKNLFLNKKMYSIKLDKLSKLQEKSSLYDMNTESGKIIRNDIKALMKELISLSNEIKFVESTIKKLNQPSSFILMYKYEKNLSVGEIANELGYSTKRIYQLHILALNEFNKIFDNKVENAKEKINEEKL